MGLLLLIPGIILLTVDAKWFDGQQDVGTVLTVVGAVLIVLQAIWFLVVGGIVKRQFDRFDDRW